MTTTVTVTPTSIAMITTLAAMAAVACCPGVNKEAEEATDKQNN